VPLRTPELVRLPDPGQQPPGRSRTILTDPLTGTVRRSVLDCGTRVLTQQMPTLRSATVGVAIPVGSRDEAPRYAGASHFLEHLLFKGTDQRSALAISASVEAVGGELNAFTGKEYTCYYARVIDSDAPLAVDVLMDMALRATVLAADVNIERDVVLEEIAMGEDEPAGVASENFARHIFAGSPLAEPVIGSTESISRMSRADVRRHYRRWYRPDSLVVAAAGGIDHGVVVSAVRRAVGEAPSTGGAHAARRSQVPSSAPALTAQVAVTHRRTEQANIVTGMPGLPKGHPDRYALAVLNASLGGGMSSRLFQAVREERGLAYSVHSFNQPYSDTGALGVYVGSVPNKVNEVLGVIDAELADIATHGLSAEEVNRGRGQVRGGLVLAQEETSARMVALAESELITGEVRSLADAVAGVDAVTAEDVQRLAGQLLTQPRQTSIVGPFSEKQRTRLEALA